MGLWDWVSEKLLDVWDKIKELVSTTEDLDTRLKQTRDDLTYHLDPVTGKVYLELEETRSDAARWAQEEAQKVEAALKQARDEFDRKIAEGDESVRKDLQIEIHELDTRWSGELDKVDKEHKGWLSRLEDTIKIHLQPAISEITTSLTGLAADLKDAWKEISWLTNPAMFGVFLVDKVLDRLLFEEEGAGK